MVISNNVGNIENWVGSVVNMVISKITRPSARLKIRKTSRMPGDSGIIIIRIMPMTSPAIIISLYFLTCCLSAVLDNICPPSNDE